MARRSRNRRKAGGQAEVKGVSGTWKDLTDNVNVLAANLTTQVRNIAKVTTAVANGDLSQKITVDARARFWSSRTRSTRWSISSTVVRRGSHPRRQGVGTEGKLGGQAEVKGRLRVRGKTSPTT